MRSRIHHWLGLLYFIGGKGLEKDYVIAKNYMEESLILDFENSPALYSLAILLSEERKGVPKNIGRSRQLLGTLIDIDPNHEDGKDLLKKLS